MVTSEPRRSSLIFTVRSGEQGSDSRSAAYVEAVDSYGDMTISEYNYGNPHDYHARTLDRGKSNYPTYFIHF